MDRHDEQAVRLGLLAAIEVRRRRDALGLTQGQLAYLAGLSEGSIRNLETDSVEPRQKTWRSVECVLGWAPGSFERLRNDEQPVEILPFEMLSTIITDFIFGQESEETMNVVANNYRAMMSSVNEHGEFRAEDIGAFVAFLEHFSPVGETEYERVGEDDFVVINDGGREYYRNFIENLKKTIRIAREPANASGHSAASTTKASSTGYSDHDLPSVISRAIEVESAPAVIRSPSTVFSVGDRVFHHKFGLGTVTKLGGVKQRDGKTLTGATSAEVVFEDAGVKILDLRYAKLKRVEESLRLPAELKDMLRGVQIIDHLASTPLTSDENLIVIALLVKRDPDRSLGARDVATFAGFQDMKRRGVVAPNLEDIDTVIHDETEA